ncbi:hypothetical protein GCM10022261_28930 [Brevibacterium daeguense]|uniref:Uncharacterized protein n=1 Tax=Brevibacterium daeguense TaxID=909936 RepID=A0ABP8EN33_9MICO
MTGHGHDGPRRSIGSACNAHAASKTPTSALVGVVVSGAGRLVSVVTFPEGIVVSGAGRLVSVPALGTGVVAVAIR